MDGTQSPPVPHSSTAEPSPKRTKVATGRELGFGSGLSGAPILPLWLLGYEAHAGAWALTFNERLLATAAQNACWGSSPPWAHSPIQ